MDILLVGAGAIPLAELVKLYKGLKQVVWVVARTSRHMDWHEVPEGEGGKASVGVWHEIIEESGADAELPSSEGQAPNLVTVSRKDKEKGGSELVEFTQRVSPRTGIIPHRSSLRLIRILLQLLQLSLLSFLELSLPQSSIICNHLTLYSRSLP